MPDSLRPRGLQPTRLLRPWDFPGKSTGVGCHQAQSEQQEKFQQRRKKSPTIMGWIYRDNTRLCNLGLKSPLCWKQLDHTKGRHTETILTEN